MKFSETVGKHKDILLFTDNSPRESTGVGSFFDTPPSIGEELISKA
jgi:hypothetical protein